MSRVGKHEIVLPANMNVKVLDGKVSFKYKHLEKDYHIPECIEWKQTSQGFVVTPKDQSPKALSLWGTTQRNLSNIVKGLEKEFTLNIDLIGVGYRAAIANNILTMHLGYSHDIQYTIPQGITIKIGEKPTALTISGHDKQLVGEVGAQLRKYRKPEPYKGKGVIRATEYVVRKEGKKK